MLLSKKKKEESAFINQLTNDIELLERLISKNLLEDYDRIGAEQEFCLIDENFRANPINQQIVKKVKRHGFVTEIAKFNMELNIEPIDLGATALRKMEEVLMQKMNNLIKILKYFDNNTIKQVYNLLLEFDNNKYTSNFKEFIINYNKMKG